MTARPWAKTKSAAAVLILTVMLGGLILVPFTARATVPTIDFTLIGKAILQLAELIFQSGQLASLVVKEYVLDPAVKLLASFMLQTITKAIIKWIQGGGNTNFVSNLQAAASRVADEAAGEFLNQLAGTNLCEPFAARLRLAFQVPTLRDRLTCTATDIFRNLQTSYNDFLRDFRNGGWLAYEAALTGPNNYTNALIAALDTKLMAESRRVTVLQAQYQAGQGFIGVRVKKPDCRDFPEYENPICTTVDVQTTPGKLVVEQLSHVFNSGIDQAVNADEISEAIDAIIVALIQKLVSSAQAGLLANNEASGIYDAGFDSLPPLPAPPPPPQNPTIRDDVRRSGDTVRLDIDPTFPIAGATNARIDTAINLFGDRATSSEEAARIVSRLRAIQTELATASSSLQQSKTKLLHIKDDLEEIDRKIVRITSDPNNIDQETLSALISNSRKLNHDITEEINNVVRPNVSKISDLSGEADRLIIELRNT